jgi:hypothetical protein
VTDGREFTFRLARGWNGQRYVATIDGRSLDVDDSAPPLTRAGYMLWLVGLLSLMGFGRFGWFAAGGAAFFMGLGFLAIRGVRWAAMLGGLWVAANALYSWYACVAADGSLAVAVVGSALALVVLRWAFSAPSPPRRA